MIITCYLLLQAVILMVAKAFGLKRMPYAYCGMVAYYGESNIDEDKFKIFMLYNESRGGDGTGIAVNNIVYKTGMTVPAFFSSHNIDFSHSRRSIVFGHARKSSVGGFGKEKAHPVAVYKGGLLYEELEKSLNITKDEADAMVPEFILVMNGTVKNTNDICKAHDVVPTANGTDTQDIALLIHKLGKEKMSEFFEVYEGACTAMWYWIDEPHTIHILKDLERPLYVWQKNKKTWISSMRESFQGALPECDPKEVLHFADNSYYRIDKGVITEKKSYKKKYVPLVTTYAGGYNSYYGSGYQSEISYKDKKKEKKQKGELLGKTQFCFDTGTGKYMRNGHPIAGDCYVDSEGNFELTAKEGYDKYFFFHGYLVEESTYNRFKTQYYNGSTFDAKVFGELSSFELSKNSLSPVKSTYAENYWSYKGAAASGFIQIPLLPYEIVFVNGYLRACSEIVQTEEDLTDSKDIIDEVVRNNSLKTYRGLENILEQNYPDVFNVNTPGKTFDAFLDFLDFDKGFPSQVLADISKVAREEAYQAMSDAYDAIDAIVYTLSNQNVVTKIANMLEGSDLNDEWIKLVIEWIVQDTAFITEKGALDIVAVMLLVEVQMTFAQLTEMRALGTFDERMTFIENTLKTAAQ